MRVLFASRYVDPVDPRANRNIVRQARVLQDEFGVELEILTWPLDDLWGGPMPDETPSLRPVKTRREGLSYRVMSAPLSWNEAAAGNVLSDDSWEAAVGFGMKLLAAQKPDIFHLHHRYGFWWLLESAQRLGIPTVYSNYDWGMACLRTVLVNGDGDLCDGVVEPEKCAACIKTGRTRLAGRINEALAESWLGRTILTALDQSSVAGETFRARGAVSRPARERTATNQKRVESVIRGLGHCVTPSEFGKRFFQQFGLSDRKVTVLPWYHDKVEAGPPRTSSPNPFTITFIGRVSPDKGVHLIFEALERLDDVPAALLRIAGANDSGYCKALQGKYRQSVGKHRVEWRGWSPVDALLRTTDVTIIPSTWMDNTPITLIEAIAYRVPVIATAIPTISELLKNGAGYLAEFNSVESLARTMKRAIADQASIRARKAGFPEIPTAHEYCGKLVGIYLGLTKSTVIKDLP